MVSHSEIALAVGLTIAVVMLVTSLMFNVVFRFQVTELQDRVWTLSFENGNLQEVKGRLQADYENLDDEYRDYQLSHQHSNDDYERAKDDSYSKGYEDGRFVFYYVKPKVQQYGVSNLEATVRELTWTRSYEENVFDCSEMSAYMERYLENEGFHAMILVGDSPFGSGRHAWVVAETTEGKYMPVEATQPRVVLWDDDYFDGYFEYERDFETIQEAVAYDSTGFDWWTVYP